jgi:hypothetical protein
LEDAAENQVSTSFTASDTSGIKINLPPEPTSLVLTNGYVTPSSDTTVPVLISGHGAGGTIKLYSDANCQNPVGSLSASGSDTITTGALADGTYQFSALNEVGGVDSICTPGNLNVVVDTTAPTNPSLSLEAPSASPGLLSMPIIRVSSITSGDKVQLATDSSCINKIGPVEHASTSTADIYVGPLTYGAHTFFAYVEDQAGNSICSSGNVGYSLNNDCTGANGTSTTYNAIGAGTSGDPHLICSKEQLLDIGASACNASTTTDCNAHFQLGAHIDMSGQSWNKIGHHTPAANYFTGTFEGNGYSIMNLTLNEDTDGYTGLFAYLSLTTVKNLSIMDSTMNLNQGTATSSHGFIAGQMELQSLKIFLLEARP